MPALLKPYLDSLCQRLSIKIDLVQEEKLFIYLENLLKERQKFNLIGSKEPKEIISLHIVDSLYGASLFLAPGQGKVLDVGTGAGLPGIIFKIYHPEIELFLLESQKKKCVFLQHIIRTLSMDNVFIISQRAEKLARDIKFREVFNLVVSRAVARLDVLAEYCLPFVCLNGYFWAFKGPDVFKEVEEAKKAINILGAELSKIEKYNLLVDKDDEEEYHSRQILIYKKINPTPVQYPQSRNVPRGTF